MPEPLTIALAAGCGLAALAWLGVLLDPKRAWQLLPVAEDEAPGRPPLSWPGVRIIIPAHNEAKVLAETLPATLAQDYPGDWGIVVVDERSTDETATVARQHSERAGCGRLCVATGKPLPDGWAGKVWGLEQGRRAVGGSGASYYLLTDADIAHEPSSLRTLVVESEQGRLALNSRMARLRCSSTAEKALIPAFVFFFNLLYPMRRVNDPGGAVAAAAGGCILVRADLLEAVGGFERIRGEIIDDVNLARAIKEADPRIRLAVSRRAVRSMRAYNSLGPIWRMVRRTAFDELDYSWLKLSATFLGMLVLFPLPVIGLALSASLVATDVAGLATAPRAQIAAIGGCSVVALVTMRMVYGPTVRLFELGRAWAWTLPFGGAVYGLITLDSARQHLRGRSHRW